MFGRRKGAACPRVVARNARHCLGLRALAFLLCLAALALLPTVASAQTCQNSFTVASGQAYSYDTFPCSDNQGTNGTVVSQVILSGPSHGTITSISGNDEYINYQNNGDSATSDAFTYEDGAGNNHTVSITIGASSTSPVTISPTSFAPGTVGQAYSVAFTASGGSGGPYTIIIDSGVLPSGITDSFNSTTSTLTVSGTPTESGSFPITMVANDAADNSSQPLNLTLVVNGGVISVSPASGSLPDAIAYANYSQPLSASGGTGPYTYSQVPGTAPPSGITIGSGGITGKATVLGTTSFSVDAADSAGNSTQVAYTLKVDAPTITVSAGSVPNGTQGSAYTSTTFAASSNGDTSSFIFAATGLPSGLALSPGGVLSGTPTSSGTYSNVVVTATDAHGFTGSSAKYTIVVAPPLAWSTTSLPTGTVGASYSSAVAASGGATPLAYAINSGALPAGLTLNANTGAITGTPTAGGTFNPSFKVTDADGATLTSGTMTLTINVPTLTVSPASGALPAATQNAAYTQTLSTTGGTPGYTYQVTSGVLPAGITVSGNTISGTPTGFGNFSFQITAMDSSTGTGPYSSNPVSYTLNVVSAAPVITTATLPGGTVGSAYTATITATGGAPAYTYQITSGTLPAGLQFNNGAISGTPTAGGTFPLTVQVTDGNGKTGTQSYSLLINAATVTITPGSLTLTDGVAVNETLGGSGGTPSYTFSVTSGSLPAGLSLSSGGMLTGTPTYAGAYSFTVQARDSSTGSGPYVGTQTYSGTIGTPTLNLQPGPNVSAAYGQAYNLTFTTAGGTAPYTYTLSGTLPTGLSFNTSTATLSGVPAQSGTFNFSVTAIDHSTGSGAPFSVTQNYTLTVGAAAITLTPGSLPNGSVGTAYTSTTFSAAGGIAPYHYAVASGSSLPPGLTLSSSGTLSGTPTSANSYSFSIQATDADGATGTQAYTMLIGAATLSMSPGSLNAATAESGYSASFSTTGGTPPYIYAVTSGSTPPGMTLSTNGTFSGTPTAAGAYTFTVRSSDSSTGIGAPFTVSKSYTVNVGAPSIAVAPTTLPGAQVAAAYSQQLTASGGNGSYSYSVSAGALPTGLTLSTSGLLSGTPTVAGGYSFTVTAKDSLNFSGSQAYTVSTQQPKPVAVNDTASTPANQAVTIKVTTGDTGPITSIAIGTAPAHGTAVVSGLTVIYTPTQNFYGTDTLTYTATGPGGTSAPATVTVTVTPLAVPTAKAQSVTLLAGNTIGIDSTTGATGGPFTATTIVRAPTSGKAVVAGNTINYSADATASGQVTFAYTLTNAFGVSQPATVTVTIDPRPVIASQSISSVAGRPVKVNLTQGATGGPFTAAALVSLTPSTAGKASIVPIAGGYQLDFTSSPTFSGAAVVTYTLGNAYATSAPGTVTITVVARPDPSKDPEVLGVLGAQADAAREFAQGQIENFQQRLESLHGGGGGNGDIQNNMTFMSGDSTDAGVSSQWPYNHAQAVGGDLDRRYIVAPQTSANPPAASASPLPDGYVLWTGGAVNFGSRDTTASANGFDFTTTGISVGLDRRFSQSFATGIGVGYGHDDTDIGHNGSADTADSYNIAWYASFSPSQSTFVDGLLGYQWLSFDALRYVTADGNTVSGSRGGHQAFASISGGYEYRTDTLLISPYGRLDVASARLDRYTEQGDAIYALTYGSQMVKTTTASIGLRMNYLIKEDYSMVMPQLRLEYGHDFQGSSQATMSYADLLAGPIYRAQVDPLTQNHFLAGLGVNWELVRHLSLRLEYEREINAGDQDDQSILINVQKKF
ncbi:putative Ig domain-containing protein [Rhodanobacter sp. Si-c]|uniref:Ig domain-containing protein n=1 Tax=Rhodanobacter lycopersici TaxID=3162487 RepID=A0ABV3QGV4_9GAMM